MPGKLPIIYVRGFAGGTSGIDTATDDPFYGFSAGSTHVRIGAGGAPLFYQFESPLVRLVTEEGYDLLVQGSQESLLANAADTSLEPATVWIHRFYDRAASTWEREGPTSREWQEANAGRQDLSRPEPFSIEAAADDLLEYVQKIRLKTGAERVHLVAHSMGGLICRSMIQRSVPNAYGSTGPRARDLVESLFTYATPHGGISFDTGGGLIEAVRDKFGLFGADIFGHARMYQFLTPDSQRQDRPPDGWDPRVNPDPDNFPTVRIFCLVGTNAKDYDVALGMSSRAVGVKSDGLVQTSNALVLDGDPGRTPEARQLPAGHAFVHRSHSGRYGVVNSEEGYQNLVRFLFGDVRVTADLVGLTLPDVKDLTWQAETEVAIRGLPVLLHERVATHHCPIDIERRPDGTFDVDRPVPLVTTYLWTKRARAHGSMRYTLHLRLLSLEEKDYAFSWRDHIEKTTDFDDTLVIDVRQRDDGDGLNAWTQWASRITVPIREYVPVGDPLPNDNTREGAWHQSIPFPAAGTFLARDAVVTLTVQSVDVDSPAGLATGAA